MTLRNLNLLAGRVVISYTLSRKWASEPDFKKGVEQLRDEYLDGFFDTFLKMLRDLHDLSSMRDKTDGDLGHEAMCFYYVSLMIDLADYTWGFVVQQRAHEKIEESLRTVQLGHFAGFLKLLDFVCYARSRGKIKVGPDYMIECRNEMDHMIQRLHWDTCVAGRRGLPLTISTCSAAQATLSRLVTSRLCGLIARGRQKEKLDTGAMMPLNTPTQYQAKHLPHLEP